MDERFSRTEMLLGKEALDKLKKSHVAVFGVGGVGGYVCEALGRSGVGKMTLIDNDTVSLSNINRQIFALQSTVGMKKIDVARKRLLDINPSIEIFGCDKFILNDNIDEIDFSSFDYVVDAIDTVTGKLAIIEKCYKENISVISSMGTGNKTDATKFEITDIYKTQGCPLARVMRRELRKRGIERLKVLYSSQEITKPCFHGEDDAIGNIPGSVAFVPSVAGLIIAGEVIKDLIK